LLAGKRGGKPTCSAAAVLRRLEEIGVELKSDGKAAWVGGQHWSRVPQDLHDQVRQCRHELGRMIGDNIRRRPRRAR
jgi:hypothetical protein